MTWLAWRQFRAQTFLALVATLAVVTVLAATRGHIAQVAGTDELSTGFESLRLLGTALVGLPAFIGAFWGAPLVARELETGTHRLVWTQTVTRRRWLGTKLTLAGAVALAATTAFSLVFTWWSVPFDHLGNRIGTANFGQRGIVPIAYALFALALGALLGAVIERTLPAMTAALAGFFVVRYAFQLVVRPHLMEPVTTTRPTDLYGPRLDTAASGAWTLSSRTVDRAGQTISSANVDRMIGEVCHLDRFASRADNLACVDDLGIRDVVTIHPANHFWTMQAREAAAFVVLAIAAAALTCWWVRTRSS